MRIVLNSDVLHMNRSLATGLANHIKEFCREAELSGAILVLPSTVMLENQRQQITLREQVLQQLNEASSMLRRWGVDVPQFTAEDLVPNVDLAGVLRATGIKVEKEDATLEDYRDAERRACLHLAPQSPDIKTDEMRDLVIWAIALRMARRDGTAMLVSRDQIHAGEHGLEEARMAGLLRAKTFDDALEQLGRVNPAGAQVRSVFGTIWNRLRDEGLPLPEEVPSRRFSNVQFTADREGHANTRLAFEIISRDGKLTGFADIFQGEPSTIEVTLTNLALDGQRWRTGSLPLRVDGELPKITTPAAARLMELRNVLEGGEQ